MTAETVKITAFCFGLELLRSVVCVIIIAICVILRIRRIRIVKAEVGHIKKAVKLAELKIQLVEVPLCGIVCLVVGESISADLLRRQIVRDEAGNGIHPELQRGLVSCMSGNDHAVFVYHNWLLPTKFPDAVCHELNRIIVLPRVVLIRSYLVDLNAFYLHFVSHKNPPVNLRIYDVLLILSISHPWLSVAAMD